MKKTSIILALLALGSATFAQKQDTVDNAYNENVIVMGSYKPVLEDMAKINVSAPMTDTATQLQHNFAYEITPQRLTSLFVPSRIKAARVIGEPNPRLYNSYVRLGMGNNWSPLLDVFYNSTRSQTLNYGAYLNHESSWGTIGKKVDTVPYSADYYGPDHWSQTNVGGFVKYIVNDKLQLSSSINYNNDYNLYYGFNDSVAHARNLLPNDSVAKSNYDISYNHLRWKAGVKNLQTDVNKLGYAANVELSDLWAGYRQNELNMNLSGDIHYGFPLLSEYKGIAYLHADWIALKNNWVCDTVQPYGSVLWNIMPMSLDPITPDTIKNVSNLVRLNPYVDFIFRHFNIHAGLKLGFDGFRTDTTQALFHIYPDLVISKSFMNEDLNISLGATGGIVANSLNSIRMVNPYILPGMTRFQASSHYDFWGRMRLDFNKRLRLTAHLEYSFLRNDLSFCSTGSLLDNMMDPIFVDLNKGTAGADISFTNDEMINLSVGGNYYLYTFIENEDDLYHENYELAQLYRPNFDAHLNVGLNYHNKWYVTLQGLLLGRMYAGNVDPIAIDGAQPTLIDTEHPLPMRTGLNLEAEYRYSKALSFFARFDNVLAQRYFYWNNYPSHRFQFLLGLTYTIH